MKSILLAISCFLALPLIAQEAPRPANRGRIVPNMVPGGIAGAIVQAPDETEALKKNITIRLHGTTTTGTDVDFSLSGVGPRFAADQVINDDLRLTCQYVVSETETGYRVVYSVSGNIKVVAQGGQNPTSYEYRDVTISGTVLCSEGSPQVLVRNGSKQLQLTITHDAKQDGASDGKKPAR